MMRIIIALFLKDCKRMEQKNDVENKAKSLAEMDKIQSRPSHSAQGFAQGAAGLLERMTNIYASAPGPLYPFATGFPCTDWQQINQLAKR